VIEIEKIVNHISWYTVHNPADSWLLTVLNAFLTFHEYVQLLTVYASNCKIINTAMFFAQSPSAVIKARSHIQQIREALGQYFVEVTQDDNAIEIGRYPWHKIHEIRDFGNQYSSRVTELTGILAIAINVGSKIWVQWNMINNGFLILQIGNNKNWIGTIKGTL